jgi:hypothetical protein
MKSACDGDCSVEWVGWNCGGGPILPSRVNHGFCIYNRTAPSSEGTKAEGGGFTRIVGRAIVVVRGFHFGLAKSRNLGFPRRAAMFLIRLDSSRRSTPFVMGWIPIALKSNGSSRNGRATILGTRTQLQLRGCTAVRRIKDSDLTSSLPEANPLRWPNCCSYNLWSGTLSSSSCFNGTKSYIPLLTKVYEKKCCLTPAID